jgi:hypothetical protein
MRLSLAAGLATSAALLLFTAAAPAHAEAASSDRVTGVTTCQDELVLASIRHRFATASMRVEKRDLQIVGVEKVREVHASVNRPSPIPRRWCSAAVTLSDGSRSTLTYLLAGGLGFAGPGLAWIPDEVEFCVAGHDRWRVHDGNCRTTRRWW